MKIKDWILIAGVMIAVGMGVWSKFSKPKIAYVRTGKLINEYLGMKEANEAYQKKIAMWEANIDSLRDTLQEAINKYKKDSINLMEKEKYKQKSYIMQLQQGLLQYSNAVNEKIAKEEEKMTLGVLNQVNSYIEKYGRENGYNIIFGTTATGNVLYGDEALDITENVLKGLNRSYKGE